jgi:hypothetical protein
MSKENGDKARFNKERKKKLLRHKRNRELRKTLESNAASIKSIAIDTWESEGGKG